VISIDTASRAGHRYRSFPSRLYQIAIPLRSRISALMRAVQRIGL
jgi:hypothetical protein